MHTIFQKLDFWFQKLDFWAQKLGNGGCKT